MTELFVRLHLGLARHRWAVLAVLLLLAGAAALAGRRLKLNEDFTDMLPLGDPAIAGQVEALKQLRQADRLFIDVQDATPEPDRLAAASERMESVLRSIPELDDFRCRVEGASLQQALEELQAQLPSLLAPEELNALENRWQPAVLEKRLAWFKQTLSQPQGMMFKDRLQNDPVGLGDALAARLAALKAGLGDARIVGGRITSSDGRHVLLSAAPRFRPGDQQQSARLMAAVLAGADAVEKGFPDGAVRIAVTGAHRMALDNASMIRADTTRTSLVATLAVAALMLAAYRRRWLALWGLVPTVVGALGAILVFYLGGDPVSAVALGCGSILVGVTVDYGIYVIYHAEDAPAADRPALARAVAQLAPTLAFGALTSMAAFLAMFASPVSGHRQLGLFGAVGVGLAALFSILILPLLIPAGQPAAGHSLPVTRMLERLFAWRDRRARLVLPLLLVFSGLCAWGLARLRFDGDAARLNGINPGTRQAEAVIRQVWGRALSLTTVMVSGASREEALRKNEQVWAVLRSLQDQRMIESFSSVAPLLPSEATRHVNRQAWQSFWTGDRILSLDSHLVAAAGRLGFRTNLFLPFLERLRAPPPAVGTDEPSSEALASLLGDYWGRRDGRFQACTLVKTDAAHGFEPVRAAIQGGVPDALLLNKAALSDGIMRVARRALPIFGVLVAVLNAALLFLLLGRMELVLITLLPMAVGIFWTLGVLGLLGLPIDMANFIFVIFVIGVGGDYSLFMVTAELEPWRGHDPRQASTGGAVTLCAMTTLLGVGVLVLARHPALFSVGLSALLGISLTLLATLFLVPPCMGWLRRRTLASQLQPCGAVPDFAARRRRVQGLYRYQGPYVAHYAAWKIRLDPLFKALDAAVPEAGTILDLGCGYGLTAHWLTLWHPTRQVRGVDHDSGKVRIAQAAALGNPRVSFELQDLLRWTEYPACDVVLLCDVLHYFPAAMKRDVLVRAFQALRPGGWLVVRDACRNDTSGHRAVARAERWAVRLGLNRTQHGLHFQSLEEQGALLRQAGFAGVETRPDSGMGSNVLFLARKP